MHALAYMRNNNLKTILDIQLKKDEVTKKLKDNKAEIENCNNKIKSIDTLLKQGKIIKENKEVFNKYSSMDNSIISKLTGKSKADYLNEHKDEIDKYKRALAIVKNLTESEKIEPKKWENLKIDLQNKISSLSYHQQEIKKEVDQIKHIKYVVEKVNEKFGIDINIEIELAYQKAIARGEKPSVTMAIEEFQKQIAKEDRQKQWAKENCKSKGSRHSENEL